MTVDASAYAALGLMPGANAAAIERAYKALIKQFHPDRAGGDAGRAAEINRAYRDLRAASAYRDALDFHGELDERSGSVRAAVFLLAAAGMLALLLVAGPIAGLVQTTPAAPSTPVRSGNALPDAIDLPLADAAIDAGIHDAVRLTRSADEIALTTASRECHRRLRTDPTIARLDRCAAFDDTVAQLQDRDPLRDRGPFSELAITGRKMSGATLLSNDYLAIDSRLKQIRLRVELALVPQLPEPQVAGTD